MMSSGLNNFVARQRQGIGLTLLWRLGFDPTDLQKAGLTATDLAPLVQG
jgi:hypothetical protein